MAGSNSKKPRKPRMGKPRGECTVKTGNAGGKRSKMDPIFLILNNKGRAQAIGRSMYNITSDSKKKSA